MFKNHDKYYNAVYVGGNGTESMVPSVIFSTGSGDNTSSNGTKYSGIDLETVAVIKIDNHSYLSPIPSATQGGNTVFSFDAAFTAVVNGEVSTKNFGFELTGSDATDVNKDNLS